MAKILGYEVTTDLQALPVFIAQVADRYNQLEATATAIDTRVAELSQDWQPGEAWNPRPEAYWQDVELDLASLREAAGQCLMLFSKGSEAPTIPIVFSALSISFRCDLHVIVERLEKTGMLLTTYRPVCISCEIKHLQHRQYLLVALRELAEQTHQGIARARVQLEKAPEEQRKLLSPRQPRLHIIDSGQQEQ